MSSDEITTKALDAAKQAIAEFDIVNPDEKSGVFISIYRAIADAEAAKDVARIARGVLN